MSELELSPGGSWEVFMVTIIIPALMAVLGAAVYLFATNPKIAELGKVLCAAGLFAVAFAASGRTLSI